MPAARMRIPPASSVCRCTGRPSADLRTVVVRTAVAHGATGIYGNHGNPATDNDPVARMLPGLQAVVGKDSADEAPLQMGSEDFP